ncbi:3-phosphoshikimate 1-carboxyvinyltransferase [Altibacter sp. HG106]|uniref:3-phosphoshikimate 1-carboxyvinyltransferase n=1 Tax=Altibacter sp. HG106 TaxID=3023937 RepID=UPI002350CF24|nr:3-phosphoshikimate 1-carboxyvinyltransferase [Altibacter sp. HG106]MDC7994403.1 3-phosphoshikimate 1-carboxyvinyltransferase [Altibacter sp. HG106]
MKAVLSHTKNLSNENHLKITGSKSESNRLLIVQQLFPTISIENLSESDDTVALQEALKQTRGTVDIHHAGTAMRFLTAYYASRPNAEVLLTGSTRMQERPIAVLVEALRAMGASIAYTQKEGCPPLHIMGKNFVTNKVSIKANVSSQYISALLLIGASLPQGIVIQLEGKITSLPYLTMTLDLLNACGISGSIEGETLNVKPQKTLPPKTMVVESDWSSASYFYSLVALSEEASITLGKYREESHQGDAAVARYYAELGVSTTYDRVAQTITLTKTDTVETSHFFEKDLSHTPDLAQTIAVTCLGLGIGCQLTGLHTLKIKETDRLVALQQEIHKLGGEVEITEDSLRLAPNPKLPSDVAIDTYQDHRMAMAFAPLALKIPLTINDAEVVSKSFPGFWNDLKKLGIVLRLK